MIIYIAGPMSGHPQNNYPAFWLAANKFRAHGLKVLNPAELPILPDWQAYMRESLKMVAEATHIHFLPGADTSRGAQIESFIAKELGIEIIGHPCTQLPCDICDSYAEEHGTEHYEAAECLWCGTVHHIGGSYNVQKDAHECCDGVIESSLICCKCESSLTEEEAQTKCYNCYINAPENQLCQK